MASKMYEFKVGDGASLEFLERTLAMSGWKKADIRKTIPLVEQGHDIVEFSNDNEA